MEHHETPRIRRPEQGAETTTKKNKDDEKKTPHSPRPKKHYTTTNSFLAPQRPEFLKRRPAARNVQKGDSRPEKENPAQLEAAGSLEGSGPLTVQKGDSRPVKEIPVQLETAGSLFEGSGPLTVQKGKPF